MLYTSKEFTEILDKATVQSEFGTLSRNIKEMIKGFDNFRSDMIFSPYWALEGWMKFIEKVQEIICGKEIT